MSAGLVFFRLELADALRSRWLAFTAVIYVAVFGLFVWLGLRESTVLGFTGLSRVVLNVSNAVVIVLPLVALIATSQTIVRARITGFFELFIAQPCKRSQWFGAVLASRIVVVAGPLVVLLLVALLAGTSERELPSLVGRSVLVACTLVWAFVGVGLLVSAMARTPERAIVWALVAWLAASALHDFALIGLLLTTRIAPGVLFALAAINPVESARLAILSGIDPDLSVLGPVGFWLSNTLGPRWTFLVGVGWPALIGAVCSWAALARLKRADLAA